MANNTKQQAVNTFTGGLNTDLHPLTTPDNILTDCINGTIITYNGNEYILQNDMGNYKLETAQLPADYIPVGIKEYGNIIYIVSYNPIDKKCQIGSYPSPQTLFGDDKRDSKDDQYHGIQIYPLSDNWHWDPNTDDISAVLNPTKEDSSVLFTTYKPQQNLQIFFPQEGELKDTYLNPGDKYWLYKEKIEEDEQDIWQFQKISYYSLNESKEAYKLKDNEVQEQETPYVDAEKMANVTWEVPGWLGYKPSLIEPASFNIYLTNIKIPAFLANKSMRSTDLEGKLEFNIQGQITIDTNNYWKRYFDNLKVFFEYKIDDGQWISNAWGQNLNNDGHIFNEENGGFLEDKTDANSTNYGNKIDVLTYNEYGSINITKGNKTIVIRATPYIIDQSELHGIVYDNLVVTYIINLDDLYNVKDIKTFDTYKYLVDTDGVTINLSITSPTANLNQITCKYKLHSINSKFTGTSDISGYRDIDSLNMIGQNIFTIDFYKEGDFTTIPGFEKENIYILELAFFNTDDAELKNVLFQSAQFLITSEMMNDFYSSQNQFQKIKLSEWTSRIKNYTNVEKNVVYSKISKTPYSEYVRAYSSDSIFDSNYYKEAIKPGVKDSNFIYPLSDTEDTDYQTAASLIVNHKDLSLSAFYGALKANISNLEYELPTPSVLNNQGLWSDMTWSNQTTSTVTSINNGVSRDKVNPINVFTLNTKASKNTNITDTSAETIYVNSLLGSYISNLYTGKEGTRWYLYKNLILNFTKSAEWNMAEIAIHNWAGWDEKVTDPTNPTKTISRLDLLYRNSLLGRGNSRGAYQVYAIASSNYHFGMIYNVRTRFNYNTLDLTTDRDDFENCTRDVDGATQKLDDFITNNGSPWVFVAMIPSSGKPYSSGSSYKRGWNFPDAGIRCHGSQSVTSSGIGIQCKDGTTKSVAVIKFFPEKYNDDFRGELRSSGDGSLYTTWMVSTSKSTTQIIKDLIPYSYSSSQKMNWCVGALLFGLGVHLYGYIDLNQFDKSFISYSGSQLASNSDRSFTIRYTRDDALKNVIYKDIDLKTQKLTTVDSLFTNLGIEEGYYSTANLTEGNFSDISITTKTNSYNHIDDSDLKDFSVKFSTFTGTLQNLLSTKISKWTNSMNYTLDKVYSDFSSGDRIDSTLNTIADLLTFEYKGGIGKFYYRGLPGVLIHPVSDGRIQGGCVRALNWSDIIAWDSVHMLLEEPTQEFQESEII